jgi:hypothetical protein
MERSSREWIGAATGIAFFVVLIISFIVAGDQPPDAKDGAQKVADFYVDNKSSLEVGAGVSAVAAVLFVFFAGYLRKVLRAGEGQDGWLSLVAFGGGVILAVSAGIDSTITVAAAETADDHLDPLVVQTFQGLFENDFIPFVIGVLTIELAAGMSIVFHRQLPVWLGWVGIVLGVCGLIGVVTLTPVGFIAVVGGALWVLALSIVMTMRARRPAAPATAAA